MSAAVRNPGPSWGFRLMAGFDRVMPGPVMSWLVSMGALCAMAAMPGQRRHSRRFLGEALGREANWRDCWRHFDAFAAFLLERFRVANGKAPRFQPSEESEDRIENLAVAKRQALYGTFHFGMSDLMGFWLSNFDLTIRMVRFQVGNSDDLEWLDRRFGNKVGFIWVNEPENMLFALKNAIGEGHSIALKCDRVEHSSKREVFRFLGKRRLFPFTVYHLAILFQLPVVFAFGIQKEEGEIQVFSSRVFHPDNSGRAENLQRARAHFEQTLVLLEDLVRRYPYQWFNFLDSLPLVEDA